MFALVSLEVPVEIIHVKRTRRYPDNKCLHEICYHLIVGNSVWEFKEAKFARGRGLK